MLLEKQMGLNGPRQAECGLCQNDIGSTLGSQMPTYVPTGRESERSWGILQAVGKADLIAKTTESKGG